MLQHPSLSLYFYIIFCDSSIPLQSFKNSLFISNYFLNFHFKGNICFLWGPHSSHSYVNRHFSQTEIPEAFILSLFLQGTAFEQDFMFSGKKEVIEFFFLQQNLNWKHWALPTKTTFSILTQSCLASQQLCVHCLHTLDSPCLALS